MRWKTPILEGVNTNIFSLSAGATLLVLLILCFLPVCFAHLEHLPHYYNGNGVGVGKYYVNQAIDPEYTPHKNLLKSPLVYKTETVMTYIIF